MARILIELFLCCLPTIFIFLTLYQISNWKTNIFHWGLIVFESSDSFPSEIPEHLTNKVIEHEGIIFKFISQKNGLFQAKVIGRRPRKDNDGPSSISGIFPLLGEIILDKSGVAKVILRIPYSSISLFVSTIISLLGFILLSQETNIDFFSILVSLFLFGGFAYVLFNIEKENLQSGHQRIKKYILKNM